MIEQIRKRDGRLEKFQPEKITWAIFKAAQACGGSDFALATHLTELVIADVTMNGKSRVAEVEFIQDTIERVLIKRGHDQTAKAFILYREKRKGAREINALIGATIDMFSGYLNDQDWRVKENANAQKSVQGLNNYVREFFTKNYWLHEVYPAEVREAYESGALHIHDLGWMGPYCAGWDLRQLLQDGFGGVPGKVESRPAKHLRAFLGQVVNSTFTTQGETAGAQAWSSIDTYCAPFIRYDKMTYAQVRQSLQEFVFNLNVPTRVGFQCPFSNLTFDLTPPRTLRDTAVIIGGEMRTETYGEFQEEMDLFNRAFCDVMMEGDALGRVFTFPIPTINVTQDFDWDAPSSKAFLDVTAKYGIPYFANYVNSDLSPEDAVSMCCRLRLDTRELRKRGGGLFGSNPLTGSVGVVTINLPRIGYLSSTKEEFKARLWQLVQVSKTSLEIKRKIVETQTENGLYPYSAHYLRHVYARTGQYWYNHFTTIGIVGMNEALQNFMGKDIASPEGQRFAIEIMHYLRELLADIQEETGHVYNLEASPAEGAPYRLAQLDRKRFPDIICAGAPETPYYTNSTQLPVAYTDDIFEVLEHQDELQSLYTGGTVLHLYLGERIEDPQMARRLIQRIFQQYKLPYLSLTPTFSICPEHGYLSGEHFSCPTCNADTEVWSRVTGYLRPVANYNNGKRQEYGDRKKYRLPEHVA
ncbi:MAG TPA: ribonucleoside triphosphate reductase [Candidatus Sumerlaeota bacterium]|nr:ribonucleoside triphosphate reductase [Candidatus Sumerlaeota bacterium]HPS00448.1 ribonucleoside triphosphate reductase [Candidatus Sumerlaeota bacterium]